MQALNDLSTTTEGGAIVAELQQSTNNFYIKKGDNRFVASNSRESCGNIAELRQIDSRLPTTGSGGIIFWNSNSWNGGINEYGGTTRPPYIGLGHEFAHARDANRGLLYPSTSYGAYTPTFNGILKSEWRAVYVENIIRSQVGLPPRTHYEHNENGVGIGPRLILFPFRKPISYP